MGTDRSEGLFDAQGSRPCFEGFEKDKSEQMDRIHTMDRIEPIEQLGGGADIGDGIGGGLDALGQIGGNTGYQNNSDVQTKTNENNNKKF